MALFGGFVWFSCRTQGFLSQILYSVDDCIVINTLWMYVIGGDANRARSRSCTMFVNGGM